MSRKSESRVRAGDRIVGIVTLAFAIGAQSEPIFVVFFRPWRDAQGALHARELRVEVPMRTESAVLRAVRAYAGKTVAATVTYARGPRAHRGEHVKALRLRSVAPVPELLGERRRQSRLRIFEHAAFGKLTLDRELAVLEGRRRHRALRYGVMIDAPDTEDAREHERVAEKAAMQARRVEDALPRLRTAIADELFEEYRRSWCKSARPVSRTAFEKRMVLHSMHVQPAHTTIRFDAGKMFTDHVVEVRLSPRGAIREVLIAG